MEHISRRSFLKGLAGTVASVSLGSYLSFAQEPIKIGASMPMTGDFSVMGTSEKEGYKLWEKVVNDRGGILGRPVKVLIKDNGTDTDKATTQYQRFITQQNVDLLFGTYSSLLGVPTSAIAEQYDMIYPSPGMGAKDPYERGFEYLFYFQPATIDEVPKTEINMLKEVAEEMPETAGITHMDDFFANAFVSQLPQLLSDAGIEAGKPRKFSPELKDYNSLIRPLANRDPDIWFHAGFFSDTVDAIEQAIIMGYDPEGIFAVTAPEKPEFKDALGSNVNGIGTHTAWYPTLEWSGPHISNQEFIDLYQEEHDGAMPDEDVAIAFSLGQGMQQAMEAADTLDNDKIKEYMDARTEEDPINTILGPFWWDDKGLPHRDYPYVQWVEGELELVWPPDPAVQTAEPLWPKPNWS